MEPWREELYHHGILGMKWGRKNGPPYPLDASDHSASEKKAGWRKSLDGGSEAKVKKAAPVRSQAFKPARGKGYPYDVDFGDDDSYDEEAVRRAHRKEVAKKVAVGAAIVGTTLLAVYGAKKISEAREKKAKEEDLKKTFDDLSKLWNDSDVGKRDAERRTAEAKEAVDRAKSWKELHKKEKEQTKNWKKIVKEYDQKQRDERKNNKVWDDYNKNFDKNVKKARKEYENIVQKRKSKEQKEVRRAAKEKLKEQNKNWRKIVKEYDKSATEKALNKFGSWEEAAEAAKKARKDFDSASKSISDYTQDLLNRMMGE